MLFKIVFVPSVAELPTCQKTSQPCNPPLIVFTDELLAVTNALKILKTNSALGLP